MNRRELFRGAAALGAVALTGEHAFTRADDSPEAVRKGRVKQSLAYWCFNVAGDMWDIEKMCQVAKQLGCVSIELVDPEHWGTLQKHELVCAIASNGMPGAPFVKGFCNPKYHDELVERMSGIIDRCAEAKFPNVIAFTGYKWRDADDPDSGEIPLDEGAKNCVAGLKKIVGYAEKKGVTICLEHLNTRDDTHPMKGHPGYMGDDLDWCAEVVRGVGSERMKLLFDIYHVQIMNGDVIRRLEQHKDILGHIHTAGVPGRAELDENQEVNYPAVIRKLVEVGYDGYVGQEFIPTRDPLAGLKQAVAACDV